MNPAAVFVLMLGIGIPLTFIKSVILNVVVSSVCLAYLLFCKNLSYARDAYKS